MYIIQESLNTQDIIKTLTYLKKYSDIYVIGGTAIALQSSYKTKDVDLFQFPYIDSIERDPNVKVMGYEYDEDHSILGFSQIKIKGIPVDILYEERPYKNFIFRKNSLDFTVLRGFNVQSISSLFTIGKLELSKLELLVKDNNLPISYVYNIKSREGKLRFITCWEAVNYKLSIADARKYLNV